MNPGALSNEPTTQASRPAAADADRAILTEANRAAALLATGELILEETRRLDPNAHCEVYASHSETLRVVFENTDFSVTSDSTTTLYGIRVIAGGRPGFVTTNAPGIESLKRAAAEAMAIARLSPASEFHQIARPGPGNGEHFRLVDPALLDFGIEAATDWTDRVVRQATRDARVTIDRAEFSRAIGCSAIVNSNGVRYSRERTLADWYVMGMARTEQEVTSIDYDGGSTGQAGLIAEQLERSVDRFVDSVLGQLGGGTGESYHGPVLLHPQAVADLLGGVVAANCNGRQHQDGISPWKNLVGEIVAAEELRIREDPLDRSRAHTWRPFDREGVRTAAHDLILAGRLRHIGFDCFTAQRGGLDPTGNATGSARSLPGIGFGPLSVDWRGQSASHDAGVEQEFGSGLLLKRFSGNRDSVSGTFSGVAKNGHWIKNGKKDRPVREVMVAGNLFDLLRQIRFGGAQLHELAGGSRAPYLVVDGISVTAG